MERWFFWNNIIEQVNFPLMLFAFHTSSEIDDGFPIFILQATHKLLPFYYNRFGHP